MFTEMIIDRFQELGLSPEAIALARGMLLGDKSVIDPEVIRNFRMSGMSHLLAVSGLHVGVIMTLVWAVLRPIESLFYLILPPRMSVYYIAGTVKRLLLILITCLYVWVIGAPVSAVRAALMLCLCQVGWILHRPTSAWNCLLLTALILLACDPWYITQVGFQLSFMAVAGILSFQPWLQEHRLSRWVRLILLSVSAQWFTVPLVAYYFHQTPLLGWLQGILVVPLIPFFVAFLLLGGLFPEWHALCLPIEAFYGWITWISQWVVQLERLLLGGHLYFYPSWLEVLLLEVALFTILFLLRMKKRMQDSSQSNPIALRS